MAKAVKIFKYVLSIPFRVVLSFITAFIGIIIVCLAFAKWVFNDTDQDEFVVWLQTFKMIWSPDFVNML